jgi:uncharacterized membrane protein
MNPNILIAIAILCWGTWGVFHKFALQGLDPASIQCVSSVTNVLLGFVYFYIYRQSVPAIAWNWNWKAIAYAAVTSVLSGTAAICYLYALKHKSVSSLAGYTALNPAVTFIFAAIFLGENFGFYKVIGLSFIMSGIWFIGR